MKLAEFVGSTTDFFSVVLPMKTMKGCSEAKSHVIGTNNENYGDVYQSPLYVRITLLYYCRPCVG